MTYLDIIFITVLCAVMIGGAVIGAKIEKSFERAETHLKRINRN